MRARKLAPVEMEAALASCSGEKGCKEATDAVLKRYEGRMATAAETLKNVPVGAAPTPARPEYGGLQPYDPEGKSLPASLKDTGFFKWLFTLLAEQMALEAMHHHVHIKLDPLPPSMISAPHVAGQLAKLRSVQTPRELACWGGHLHKLLVTPYMPNSKTLDRMMESVMQLKDPGDPEFVACPEAKK